MLALNSAAAGTTAVGILAERFAKLDGINGEFCVLGYLCRRVKVSLRIGLFIEKRNVISLRGLIRSV